MMQPSSLFLCIEATLKCQCNCFFHYWYWLTFPYSLFSWKKLSARASFEWDVHPRQPSLLWHSRIRPTLICYLSTFNLIWKLSFVEFTSPTPNRRKPTCPLYHVFTIPYTRNPFHRTPYQRVSSWSTSCYELSLSVPLLSRNLVLCSYCLFFPFYFRRCSPLGNFRHVYQAGIPNASEATNEDLLESRTDFPCWYAPCSVWLALFIALAGLATSSCKAVASGLAVGEGLVVKSDSPCLRFGLALAYLKVLSFERDPIRRPSLPATLTEGLFFTSRHDKRQFIDRPLLFL